MLTFNVAQLRFANKLSKQSISRQPTSVTNTAPHLKRKNDANLSLKTKLSKNNEFDRVVDDSDVPLSTEFIHILEEALAQDANGYLNEGVASRLSQPLDSMAVFCPTASILHSKYAAPKISNDYLDGSCKSRTSLSDQSQTFSTTTTAINNNDTSDPLSNAKSRLNVLWLRRKAELYREEGQYGSAVAALEDAIEEHLKVQPGYKEHGMDAYLKANLSQPALSLDPQEIIDTITSNFFPFDKSVHIFASRIQRKYRQRFRFKSLNATILSRFYRGHLCRRKFKKEKEIRRQCAIILQRRFRFHLRRMHALATKIKRWYLLRRDVKEYQRKLRIYQMARRIQRLFRGMKGRELANLKRFQLMAARAIQKNCRRYFVRRDRAFQLCLYHKMFFLAARKIQKLIRKVLAVRRAQIQLLVELTREKCRHERERNLVEEILRIERVRFGFYTKTSVGEIHLKYMRRFVNLDKKARKVAYKQAETDGLVTRKVIETLERFDDEGSGSVAISSLKSILKKLYIPVNKEKLAYLVEKMDPNDSGYFNLASLLDWYSSEDADDMVEPETASDILRQAWLKVSQVTRQRLRDAFRRNAEKYSRAVYQQKARWLSRDVVATFRISNPPKYQCCQCLKPFVLFTDYFLHFDSKGSCGVLSQKAQFYPNYWSKIDWDWQRQCEYEVIRLNDEHNYVKHQCCLRLYTYFSIVRDPKIQVMLDNQIQLTLKMYTEKFKEVKKKDLNAAVITSLLEISNPVLEGGESTHQSTGSPVSSIAKTASFSLFVLDCFAESFRIPMREKWVLHGEELSTANVSEVRRWLGQSLKQDSASKEDASFSDQSENVSVIDVVRSFGSGDSDRNQLGLFARSRKAKQGKVLIATEGRMRQRMLGRLSSAHVHVLRIRRLIIQSSLTALCEYRSRRIRRMTMPEDQLINVGLQSATLSSFDARYSSLLKELSLVEQLISSMHTLHQYISFDYPLVLPDIKVDLSPLKPRQSMLATAVTQLMSAAIFNRRKAVQVDPTSAEEIRMKLEMERAETMNEMNDLKVSPDDLLKIDLQELVTISSAEERRQWRRRVWGSSAGQLLLRIRLGDELWAVQQDQAKKGGEKKNELQKLIRFVFLKLTYWGVDPIPPLDGGHPSSPPENGLSTGDVDLLGEALGLRLPAALPLPRCLPGAVAVVKRKKKTSKQTAKGLKVSRDRLRELQDLLDPESSGAISLEGLQGWVMAGSHRAFTSLWTSGRRRLRDLVCWLRGTRYEYREVHARSVLAAEIRRRNRAELHMLRGLSRCLGEVFLNPEANTEEGDEEGTTDGDVRRLRARKEVTTQLGEYMAQFDGLRFARMSLTRQLSELPFHALVADKPALVARPLKNPSVRSTQSSAASSSLSLWHRFASLRAGREDLEDLLLLRLLQRRASRRLLLHPTRRGQLLAERRLLGELQRQLEVARKTGSSSEQLLELWLRLFDVDCSGAFDEGRLVLVLRTLRALPVPSGSKELLAAFPQLRMPGGRVSVEELLHLLVGEGVRGLRTVSRTRAALLLLSCWARLSVLQQLQLARAQAVAHPGGHHLVRGLSSESHLPTSADVTSRALRAQLLATRQLTLYLSTSHGRLQLLEERRAVRDLWTAQFGPLSAVSVEPLLAAHFAFSLHCLAPEGRLGLLASELPHLLHFLAIRLKLSVGSEVCSQLQCSVRSEQWLQFPQVWAAVSTYLPAKGIKMTLRCNEVGDALVSMRSTARQQAVLLSSRDGQGECLQSRLRCAVLGLHTVIQQARRRRRSLWTQTKKKSKAPLDWSYIPKEAAPLFLLSQGWHLKDLLGDSLKRQLGLGTCRNWPTTVEKNNHVIGVLQIDSVRTQHLLAVAKAAGSTGWGKVSRYIRCCCQGYRTEYRGIVKAMQLQLDEVEAKGGVYLRELLTGISAMN